MRKLIAIAAPALFVACAAHASTYDGDWNSFSTQLHSKHGHGQDSSPKDNSWGGNPWGRGDGFSGNGSAPGNRFGWEHSGDYTPTSWQQYSNQDGSGCNPNPVPPTSPVPLPTSLPLMASGIGLLAFLRRRKRST